MLNVQFSMLIAFNHSINYPFDLEKDVGVESEVDVKGKGVDEGIDTENEGDPVVDHGRSQMTCGCTWLR